MAKKKSGIASKAAQKVADKKAQEKALLDAEVVKPVVEETKVEIVEEKKSPVKEESLKNRPKEIGNTDESLAEYRDKMLIEILKLHNKL